MANGVRWANSIHPSDFVILTKIDTNFSVCLNQQLQRDDPAWAL